MALGLDRHGRGMPHRPPPHEPKPRRLGHGPESPDDPAGASVGRNLLTGRACEAGGAGTPTPVTEAELTLAIDRTLVAGGKLPPGDAAKVARIVLGYFGATDAVLDNKVSSEDRDHFYRLEEEGLVSSEEEDATVSRGKTWRIHYWFLKKARIQAVNRAGEAPTADETGAVYREISSEHWNRGERQKSPPPG